MGNFKDPSLDFLIRDQVATDVTVAADSYHVYMALALLGFRFTFRVIKSHRSVHL